jgi:hypothetical protein
MVITDVDKQAVKTIDDLRAALGRRPKGHDPVFRVLKGAKPEFRVLLDLDPVAKPDAEKDDDKSPPPETTRSD